MAKEYDHKYIARLVIMTQQNNSDAFAELYAMTYNKVYNYARHYMRDDFLAQDAVQEIYMAVLKKIDSIKDPSLFIAWLNQIAFHVCYDMKDRQSGVQAEATEDELLTQVMDTRADASPEMAYMEKDEHIRLRECLEKLPAVEKQCIVMKYYNSMKLENIADALDISRSTVKRYIASAEASLKHMLRS